jgi:hypothetical protein
MCGGPMRRSFVVLLLCLVGCKGATRTFEISSWVLSHESTPLALHSAQGDLRAPMQEANLEVLNGPPLRFSVVESPLVGTYIRGDLPSLSFNEVRIEQPTKGNEGLVEARAEALSLPLRVLGQSVAVLVDEVSASGSLQKNNLTGKLSGRVAIEAAAAALVQLASRLPEGSSFDADGDGEISVIFDRRAARFTKNELSKLFDIAPSGEPRGLFGVWFQLDADQDGIADSMLIELSFEALAVR